MNKCADIIVTYNRLELLKENITSLLNQTYKQHDILIINNASTDDTENYVLSLKDERIKYYNTGKNLGGAGGFSYGIEKAIGLGYQYAWIMDDDSIPKEEALESLINKAELLNNKFSFLASTVYWIDNKVFPMNLPTFKYKRNLKQNIQMLCDYKLIEIDSCSFVGCFINIEYAKKIALPISEFFIYGDDVEYTSRLKKEEKAYFDIDSLIIHKAPSNKGADIATASEDRISRFYLQSRNGVYIARKNHKMFERLLRIIKRFFDILVKAPDNKIKRIWMLIKGSFVGLFFNPELKYFKKGVESNENKNR